MDSKLSNKPKLMKDKDEKKGGAVAVLMSKLGLGGGAAGVAGGGAALGGAGSPAVGLGLLMSKTGIVTLLAMGTAAAVGINAMRGPVVQRPVAGGSVFASQGEGARDTMADVSAAGEAAARDGASSSLDYFNKVNQGSVPDPAKAGGEGVAEADAPADAEDAEEVGSGVEAPDNSNGGARSASSAANAARPKMVKAEKTFKGKSSSSTDVTLIAQKGLAGGSGGGFAQTYKAPARTTSGTRTSSGARSVKAISRGTGRSALGQAKVVQKSNRNALMSKKLSSAGAGRPYDSAGARSGTIGGPAGLSEGGASTGGAGIGDKRFKPNRSLDTRELPEPKKIEDAGNKTPYQDTIKHAMIGIMAAGALLMVASLLKKNAVNPMIVRAVAGLAAVAAGVAIMKGMELMSKYGQDMQGMMFAGMGGIILIQAAMILIKPDAGEEAKAGVDKYADTTKAEAYQKMHAVDQLGDKATGADLATRKELAGRFGDLPKDWKPPAVNP